MIIWICQEVWDWLALTLVIKSLISEIFQGVWTRFHFKRETNVVTLLSKEKLKNIDETLSDVSWIKTMKEELNQFGKNEYGHFVSPPKTQSIICMRLSNRLVENGKIIENKTWLESCLNLLHIRIFSSRCEKWITKWIYKWWSLCASTTYFLR